MSCGEASNIKIKDNTLVVETDKKYLKDLINTEVNTLTLKRIIRFLGYDLDIKIELIEGQADKIEKDIEFLKEKFGNYLKIE